MRTASPRIVLTALAAMAIAALATPAHAADIRITVTNGQPGGGFAFSPVWFGLHDGSFDYFHSGATASAQVTALAELGNSGPLASLFAGHGVSTVVKSGGALPQFTPGASASTTLNVANPAIDQYLSYGAMVVPSNDLFFGNDSPTAVHLFNASGQFLGPVTITILGSDVWDAQTEQDSILNGGAFIQGVDATFGTQITDGKVTRFLGESNASSYLQSIDGLTTAAGYPISHVFGPSDVIATITISSVPEPSTIATFTIGLAGTLVAARHRRRRSAAGLEMSC